MTAMTTQQLVDRLGRSGLRVTAESLRQDVSRGLISPLMPSIETPGRGMVAEWSPMSVQRALRMARLRRRKVNGHVLPLLLFLEDGWGWKQILPTLQQATGKAWVLDRAHLNKPTRVRTPADLVDNAQQTEEWARRPDHGAIRDFRTWLFGQLWYGETLGEASPLPLMADLLPTVLGVKPTPKQRDRTLAAGRHAVHQREVLALPARDLGSWLATLDADTVEKGRQMFWLAIRLVRYQQRIDGATGSTNPLTLGGLSPAEMAAHFRNSPGRLTLAQVLGVMVTQAIVMAEHAKGWELPLLDQ